MSDTTTPTIKRKSPRWMKVLLVISISLNLLIVGAIGSRMYFGPPHFTVAGKHGQLARPDAMRRAGLHMMWKLPREKRREIHQLVRNHRAEIQPQLQALAQARTQFANTLKTDYTPQQLDAALAKMYAAQNTVEQKSNELIVRFIDRLTPQERKQYAEILLAPTHRRWFKHKN